MQGRHLARARAEERVPGEVHARLAPAVQLHIPEEPEREDARAPHALPRHEVRIHCLDSLTSAAKLRTSEIPTQKHKMIIFQFNNCTIG